MTAILTAAEMRALERAAIDSGAVTGLELMERAGRGVVEAILAEWPGIEDGTRRSVVLCGPGNNGGDGFVVARLLRERGWEVEALAGATRNLPPDAQANHDRLKPSVRIEPLDLRDPDAFHLAVDEAILRSSSSCLVVDAIFGLGLCEEFRAVEHIGMKIRTGFWDGDVAVKVVSIDVPSGLAADSGEVLGKSELHNGQPFAFSADLTVTFQHFKPGHLLADGPTICHKVVVADLGLAGYSGVMRSKAARSGGSWTWWQSAEPLRGHGGVRKNTGHKYDHGHALILAGGCGHGGAARLAARGALRIGAGLVTLAVPPAALQENAARLDAVMLLSVRDPEALAEHLGDARLNALCVGPGFGLGKKQAAMLAALLDASAPGEAGKGRTVVLDADALTLLSRDEVLRAKLHAACVLTPHEGEFVRLFPAIDVKWRAPATTGPAFSKVDAAREAAASVGCVVLLKGPDTVIAEPSGRAAINSAAYDRAAPWLATAGSGDVLAGFIAGLLARGFSPFDAACTAAWLHVECARSFGPGLIAEDLPEELPKVFRALGL